MARGDKRPASSPKPGNSKAVRLNERIEELAEVNLVPIEGGVCVALVSNENALGKVLEKASIRQLAFKCAEPKSSSLPSGGLVIVPEYLERTVEPAYDGNNTLKIKISGTARIEDVAHKLKANEFLPLAGAPGKSVVGRLFRSDPISVFNYFQRSTPTLRDRLLEFSYVPIAQASKQVALALSKPRTWLKQSQSAEKLEELLIQGNVLVNEVTLEANSKGPQMKVYRSVIPYNKILFENVVGSFSPDALKDLDEVDVTVEAFNKGFYVASVMLVAITVCSSRVDKDPEEAFKTLFPNLSEEKYVQTLKLEQKAVMNLEVGAVNGLGEFGVSAQKYSGEFEPSEFDDVKKWYQRQVDDAANNEKRNIQSHFRLMKNGKIQLYAAVFGDDQPPKTIPVDQPLLIGRIDAPKIIVTRSRSRPFRFEKINLSVSASRKPLEGLENIHILQPGDSNYDIKQQQYASVYASYSKDLFSPTLIAIPGDIFEIVTIVNYAAKKAMRVVVRSGGHQYCGFSSGGDNYIQVLMEGMAKEPVFKRKDKNFDGILGCSKTSFDKKDKKGKEGQWLATVSAHTRLEELSSKLMEKKLTVPHGECPKVCIGGHVQTGGYGHQLRGLGLCLDYVHSFTIVVHIKTKEGSNEARIVTVYHPELTGTTLVKDPLNDQIYKGVLGGSPGAFGVLTDVTFLCVSDDDPAVGKSQSLQDNYLYHNSAINKVASEVVKLMLEFTKPGEELVSGLDVFVTIVSKRVSCLGMFVVCAELAYTGNKYTEEIKNQMNHISHTCGNGPRGVGLPYWFKGQELKERLPSVVAYNGVRTVGNGITKKGREFDWPYKKRVNITLESLTGKQIEDFAQEFAKMAGKVLENRKLRLVIQMNLGGGKLLAFKSPHTGIPYREQKFMFVFDIFYEPGSETDAENIQSKMGEMLDTIGGFNHRVLWGSFEREGGKTDMTDAAVRNLYYGSDDAYTAIQNIKKSVDPNNLFTTEFTVQG